MSKSIIQIRQELEQASKEQRKSLLDAYQSDPRKGVQNLIEKYHKKELALQKEMQRLEQMHFFEKKYAAAAITATRTMPYTLYSGKINPKTIMHAAAV